MTNMLEDVWLFIVISLQLFCGFEVFFSRNKTLKVSEAAVCERNYRGSPTPVFLPGESQVRGAWWAADYGVAPSRTRLKQLSSSSSSSSSRVGVGKS